MKNIKKLVASALIFTTTMTTIGCSKTAESNTTTDLNPKTVLAELDGEQILLSDVDAEISALISSLKEEHGEDLDEDTLNYINSERVYVLQQLIQEKILLKKAEELDLIPNEEDLNTKIEENIQGLIEYYGGEEELNQAKEYYGYTDDSFNEFIKSQVIQEAVVEEVTKDITVSEEEINEFYEENKDYYFTQNEGANALHILFETEDDAKEAKAKIDSGEVTFDELFKKYLEKEETEETEDADSSISYPLSEDLGFVEYEQQYFDTDFLAGFKEVKEGEISEPVKSSFGYHLISVSGISNEKVVTPLEDVKDVIISQVEYEKKLELFQNKLIEWESEYNLKVTAESIGYSPEEE